MKRDAAKSHGNFLISSLIESPDVNNQRFSPTQETDEPPNKKMRQQNSEKIVTKNSKNDTKTEIEEPSVGIHRYTKKGSVRQRQIPPSWTSVLFLIQKFNLILLGR
jgi:hypothetical protein